MADLARSLVCKVIEEHDLLPALNAGVRADWFEDPSQREAWSWIIEYFTRYNEAPTLTAFKRQFPAYRVVAAEEPYDYYLDGFREQRQRSILVDTVVEANDALEGGDHRTAQESLSRGLLRLGREITSLTDHNAVKHLRDRFDYYEDRRQNAGVLTGVPTGFPSLDLVTSGFHPEQFILFGGSAKQGKSFLLMKSAIAAQAANKKVLFISFEMSKEEQLARYDGIQCGVNAMKLIHGTLSDDDMKRLRHGMRLFRNLPSFIISADISATTTVSSLAAKIEQHRPDILFVDGVYLMESESGADPGSAQAYTAISRGLKRLAQRSKIPVIGSTQALTSKMGRGGAVTLHSLGWTSAWSQDADVILGVERMEEGPFINLRVVAGRNVSPREIRLACDWERSMLEECEGEVYDPDEDYD